MNEGTQPPQEDIEIGPGPVLEKSFRFRFECEVRHFVSRQTFDPPLDLGDRTIFNHELGQLSATVPIPFSTENVRALRAVLEGFLLMCRGRMLHKQDPKVLTKIAVQAYEAVLEASR